MEATQNWIPTLDPNYIHSSENPTRYPVVREDDFNFVTVEICYKKHGYPENNAYVNNVHAEDFDSLRIKSKKEM